MKTKFYFLALAAAAMTFTACEKDPANTGDPDSGNGGETPETPAPEFSITSESTVSVPAVGGDFEITYEIKNPATGGRVTAETDAEWISDLSTKTSGKVTFRVIKNSATTERSSSVNVTYVYGDEKITKTVSVEQAAGEATSGYDYDKTILGFMGVYYGNMGTNSFNFALIMSDMELEGGMFAQAGSTNYTVEYYVPVDAQINFSEDRSTAYPYEGTYELSSTDGKANTMGPNSKVQFADNTTASFTDGTLTVTKEGDNYIFDAVLTDDKGNTHHIVYSGNGSCMNYAG